MIVDRLNRFFSFGSPFNITAGHNFTVIVVRRQKFLKRYNANVTDSIVCKIAACLRQ
jgi:hypothetical protein